MLYTLSLSVERVSIANETVAARQRLVLPQSEDVYPKDTGYAPRPGCSFLGSSADRTQRNALEPVSFIVFCGQGRRSSCLLSRQISMVFATAGRVRRGGWPASGLLGHPATAVVEGAHDARPVQAARRGSHMQPEYRRQWQRTRAHLQQRLNHQPHFGR